MTLGLEPPADPVGVRVSALGKKAEKVFWWLQDAEKARQARPAAATKRVITVEEIAAGTRLHYTATATALVNLARAGLVERLTPQGVAA